MKTFRKFLVENTSLLFIPYNNSKLVVARSSMFKTMKDMQAGAYSKTTGVMDVWQREDGKYLLVDGYHRIFEHLLFGGKGHNFQVVGHGHSDYYKPQVDEFQFDTRLKYGGLEQLADEEILEELKQQMIAHGRRGRV